MCITAIHGTIPQRMTEVILVPIIKNKVGYVNSQDNYRPIAITLVFSKVLEHLLLVRCESYIETLDNQFGFKEKHSTDLCILVLKEIIRHYNTLGSNMSVRFLDASKAF
ncbi:uncharacterized protein LOC102804105 [Saccoglossus kowalevskii]|uniref:Uncharacterized protein LOC102804105 n=1 Tax=Saccoglossus kowalevskii TaxID=10224 RepID=A0ABM0MR02_SACKO|nr:PREDICTED: uncharacterized protein LOC102804105 [Saccoglossus kowalevskii]